MAEPARLHEALVHRVEAAGSWLARALESPPVPSDTAFRALFASVPRRLASAARARPEPPSDLAALLRPGHTLTDWARAALLAAALGRVPAERGPAEVLVLFERGEIGEQESILRTLALLDDPARFVETGVLGARSNAVSVFSAIASDNPFPAAHFPELYLNQLVMKAIFVGVPVASIEGLAARRGPELSRMLADYRSERLAAGRCVPNDVTTLLEGFVR